MQPQNVPGPPTPSDESPSNIDQPSVHSFGEEWSRFDQSDVAEVELRRNFEAYFEVFPWDRLPTDAIGFDMGCGSGRWARFVAPRVGTLHCVDASEQALTVARRNLRDQPNCVFHQTSVDQLPFGPDSMDFGFSLGVLHHVPDTAAGIRDCVRHLKPGAPLLLYLYYAFDNRPVWFRALWRFTDLVRRGVSRAPPRLKHIISDVIAATVYWPLARAARLAERAGANVAVFPLSFYRDLSFYTMRTDALDRFGTRLEQRFTARQIRDMMTQAGLRDIRFRDGPPHWCAVSVKS